MYGPGDLITFSGTGPAGDALIVIGLQGGDVEIPVRILDDGTFGGSAEAGEWDAGTVTATITVDSASAETVFEFKPSKGPVMLEGRTASDIRVGDDRISMTVEPGSAAEVSIVISHRAVDSVGGSQDSPLKVMVDGMPASHSDESTAEHRVLVLDVPESGHVIDVSPTDAAGVCSGTAACITGVVEKITDGDTIRLKDGTRVRFSLASAPENSQSPGARRPAR